MTGRILQEDSSLLLTEANEPLQNDNFIGATGFATGSPVLGTSSIAQTHTLAGVSVTISSPVVSSVAITENNILSTSNITTGAPAVSSATMFEEETFASPDILTGAPVVGTSPISQTHNISLASIVTRAPSVGTTADPNWLVKQEIQELQDMFGGWPRRAYEVPDGRLVQAEREIEATFGDKVSVDRKAKSLIKFGKSAALGTTRETVWTVGGNETYVNDNLIDSISSSSVNDSEEIYLECHTVTGTGENQQFTFLTQTVSLNGQTRVALPVPVARVSRVYNNNGTELVGTISVYEDTPIVGGVPSDRTKIHAQIPAGFQQSFKGATTFSNEDYYILTGGFGSVSYKQSAAVNFYLEFRQAGKVFRQGAAISANSAGGAWQIELDPAIIIPKNADVRVTCQTDSQGAEVYASFKGYLAKVL